MLADFEAGLGTVTRLKPGCVDLALVVAEPTLKAIDVAQRALAMIRERQLAPEVVVIGNRVASDEDRAVLERTFAGETLLLVPDDHAIRDAGVRGAAPIDAAPASPAVTRLRDFAAALHAAHQ